MNKKVRVRFPPSPTGIPHIGNTRTAFFNYLFSRHNNGDFILRIEDTDQARLVTGSEEAIFEILKWLGITYDEKYKQSERLDIYRKHTEELLLKELAYQDEGAVRFKIPKGKIVEWKDAVGEKEISFKSDDLEDFVILKSDGFPTYHLANVIDDHLMEISHVIRGDEWISSTPKHILLYKAFGWQHPVFCHLPVILGSDHSKLSKRHGAESALDYRDKGYLPEALLNYMALLGWSPGGDRELMSIPEMVELFDLEHVNTASPIFDPKKLEWMNGLYMREKISDEELKIKLLDFYKNENEIGKYVQNDAIIKLAKTRMTTLMDFKNFVEKSSKENSNEPVQKELLSELSKISDTEWLKDKIFEAFKKIMENNKIKMPVLYKIFTGREHGLPLPDFLEALGREESLSRIK